MTTYLNINQFFNYNLVLRSIEYTYVGYVLYV